VRAAAVQLSYDVAVLGSGAAGLTAALAAAVEGARVGMFEKAELLGGTTALSGGTIWIPGNRPARDAGVEDSLQAGLEYLESLSLGMILPELAEALIEGGPRFVEFVEENTELRFQLVEGYPDYHPERPGGLPRGGRSIEVKLVSFAGIEEWSERIAGEVGRLMIKEMLLGGGTGVLAPEVLAERDGARLEGLGRGLVAGLLKACLEHGVQVMMLHGAPGSFPATAWSPASRSRLPTASTRCSPTRWCLRPVGSNTTPTSSVTSCAALSHGRSVHPRTRATVCGWRCGWALSSATCGRRGGPP
jgi:hypothetical protein